MTCTAILRRMSPHSKMTTVDTLVFLTWSLQECVNYHVIDVDISKCVNTAKECYKVSNEKGYFAYYPTICSLEAYALLSAGKLDEAQESIDMGFLHVSYDSYFDLANLHSVLLYRDLICGNYQGALKNGNLTLLFTQKTEGPFLLMYAHLGLSQALFEMKMYEESFEHLELGRRCVENVDGFNKDYIFQYPEAYYYITLGQRQRGVDILKKALKTSASQNILNLVYWRPDVMTRLYTIAMTEDIETDYVSKMIDSRAILPKEPYYEMKDWPFMFRFHTLGQFQIIRERNPLNFKGKTPKKALILLKALIAYGKKGIAGNQISDMLWADSDGDDAHVSLKFTLHKLRQIMGNKDLIIHADGRAFLDFRISISDCFMIDEIYDKFKSFKNSLTSRDNLNGHDTGMVERLTNIAMELYKGDFLPDEEHYAWIHSSREQLKNHFMYILAIALHHAMLSNRWEEAEAYALRQIKTDIFNENSYKSLIACYGKMGNIIKAHKVYLDYQELLSVELGIKPGFELVDIIKTPR